MPPPASQSLGPAPRAPDGIEAQVARFPWLLALVLALAGCTPGYLVDGDAAMVRGDYGEAERVLQRALIVHPDDARILNRLGWVALKESRTDAALEYLTRARELDPTNGESILYLGMTYEARDDVDAAVDTYRHYASLGALSRDKGRIRDRLEALSRRRAEIWAVERRAAEDSLGAAPTDERSLGVVAMSLSSDDEDYAGLGAALAGQLSTDLAKVRALTVVERLRLDAILRELELAASGAVDSRTAPRVGRLLGARTIVSGDILPLPDDVIRVDLAIVDTGAARVMAQVGDEAAATDFFELESALAFSILDVMGIEISEREREEIARAPTRSLAAFLAYGRGLEADRAGRLAEAESEYRQALALDPSFAGPSQALGDLGTGAVPVSDAIATLTPPSAVPAGAPTVDDRTLDLLDVVGDGTWGERPDDGRVDPNASQVEIPRPPTPPEGGK